LRHARLRCQNPAKHRYGLNQAGQV